MIESDCNAEHRDTCAAHTYLVKEVYNHKNQLRSITRLLITTLIGVIMTLITLLGGIAAAFIMVGQ